MLSYSDLSTVFNSLRLPVLVVKPNFPDFTIMENNHAFTRLLSDDDIVIGNEPLLEVFDKQLSCSTQTIEQFRDLLQNVVKEKKIMELIISGINNDFSFDVVVHPLRDEVGDISFLQISFHETAGAKVRTDDNPAATQPSRDEHISMPIEALTHGEIFEEMVKDCEDLISMVDRNGKTLYASPAILKRFGYTLEECQAFGSKETIHPDDIPKISGLMEEIIASPGITVKCPPIRVLKKDSSYSWVEGTITNYLDREGIRAIVTNFRDITGRVEAEESLQYSEKKYRYLFDNNPLPMFIYDFKTLRIIDCNEEALSKYGYTREEFLALTVKDIRPPEDIPLLLKAINIAEVHNNMYRQLWRHRKKSGEIMDVEVNGHLMTNNGRQVSLVQIHDVTLQLRSERMLEESERKLSLIYNSVSDSIFMLSVEPNNKFKFKSVNSAFLDTTGLNEDQVVGKFVSEVIPDPSLTLVKEKYQQAIQTKERVTWEEETPFPTGPKFGIVTITPIMDAGGICTQIIGSVHDVTRERMAGEILEQSEEKYKQVFRYSPLPKWILDYHSLEVLDVNESASLIYGYNREEFLQLTLYDITDNAYITKIGESLDREKDSTGVVKYGICVHVKSDGSTFQTEISASRFTYLGKEALLVVSNDVMERENALLLLKSHEAKLVTAQKIAKLGYWQLLPSGTNLYWSDEVYSIWGVDKLNFELNFQNFSNTIHPDDRDAFITAQELAFTGACELNFVHRIIVPDGTMKWVHEIGNLRKDDMGRPIVFEGTVQDITQQKSAQLALEQRNNFIETAIENLPIGIAVNKISTGEVTLINTNFTNIYGWPANVLTDVSSFFHKVYPDDNHREAISARIMADIESGDVNRMAWKEIEVIGQNGEKKIINAKNIPLYDQDLMISTVVDVTEQVSVERQIKLANERFNYVNLASRDAIYDWNVITDTFSWGESFKRIFGHDLTNKTFKLNDWNVLMHPDDSKNTQQLWDKFLADIDSVKWAQEFQFQNSEGEYLFVEEIGYLIRDAEGHPTRMIGVLRDQTQRKKEEQQLRLLESVITSSDNAVMITEAEPMDEPGPRIVFINQAFTKMTGYSLEDVRGKSPRLLQGPKSDRVALARLGKAMRSWEPSEATVVNYKKNGEEFWVNFAISAVKDDKGWYTHWIATERNVTAQKNEEEQKKLMAEISSLFNQSLGFSEALVKILAKIRDVGNYSLAEVWLLDADNSRLNLAAKLDDDERLKAFYEQTAGITHAVKGLGLPGKVWETESIHHWSVEKGSPRLREQASRDAGLLKVYGIPLFYNNSFIGAMLLGSHNDFEILNDFIALSENFGAQIGTEIKRKQLEEELNQIFRLANDIICIEDKDGYFKKINPAACEFLEYTEKELLNTPYTHFIHPDDVKISLEAADRLFRGEGKVLFENRYRTKSGKIKWLEWTATKAPEENLIYSVGRDITESKNLSGLLEKSNRMAAIGSWEIDLINNTVFWSDITKEIREAAPDFKPDLGTGIRFFKEGKDQDIINQRLTQCKIDGTPWDEELQIITFKGNLKWIRTIGEAEFVNGKCIRIYGSFQDINAKKNAELESLRNLEEKNTILESIGDAFFAIDEQGLITYWNVQAEKMLGFQRENVVGKSLWEIFPVDASSIYFTQYHLAITEKKVVRFEAPYPFGPIWLEVSVYPNLKGLSVYLKDSTLKKEAEERIRVNDEKNRLIMFAALDAIVCMNQEGNVIFWNPQAENIFGWKESEMLGKKLSDHIVPEKYRQMHDNGLAKYLKTGKAEVFNKILDLRGLRKNGDEFAIELAVIPIKQETDEFFCAFIRDITARKLVEIQLKDLNQNLVKQARELAISNQELEQFAYVASHDLQEPLRMITSFIKQLEKKYSDVIDDKGKQYIHFAVDGAVRMRQIILDLLEFSRAGRWDEKIEKVDLNDVLNDILVLFARQIEETRASITLGKLPILLGSRAPVRQVLQNLLSNALKYRRDDVLPEIQVTCREEETLWEIIISDNGIGIEPEFHEKIFIIFQRLHNKDEYSGTGIGLAIVKKIVENMNGKIRLESERGKGTTFYLSLPKI